MEAAQPLWAASSAVCLLSWRKVFPCICSELLLSQLMSIVIPACSTVKREALSHNLLRVQMVSWNPCLSSWTGTASSASPPRTSSPQPPWWPSAELAYHLSWQTKPGHSPIAVVQHVHSRSSPSLPLICAAAAAATAQEIVGFPCWQHTLSNRESTKAPKTLAA